MITECNICGEEKECKEYVCKFGVYQDYMFLCKDCVKIQEKEGPVEEATK